MRGDGGVQATRGTPIMYVLFPLVKLVRGDGRMSGILHLSLNSAGMKGLPNAREIVTKGNYCHRAEATAGSCTSLPRPVGMCTGGYWCSQHLGWLEDS